MPGASTKWGTPWPLLTESANMDDNISDMAFALDNIAKDVTQNTLANRPSTSKIGSYFYATDYGVLFRWNGTAWTMASQALLVTAPNPLPSNPDDGMIVDYLADATGVVFRLRYRADSPSSYRWECQTDNSLYALQDKAHSTTSASYAIPGSNPGPTLDIPLVGEWLFEYGCHILAGDADGKRAYMSPDISSAGSPSDDDAVYHAQQVWYDPGSIYLQASMMNGGSREKVAVISSARTINTYFRAGLAGKNAYFQDRWIRATPMRLA